MSLEGWCFFFQLLWGGRGMMTNHSETQVPFCFLSTLVIGRLILFHFQGLKPIELPTKKCPRTFGKWWPKISFFSRIMIWSKKIKIWHPTNKCHMLKIHMLKKPPPVIFWLVGFSPTHLKKSNNLVKYGCIFPQFSGGEQNPKIFEKHHHPKSPTNAPRLFPIKHPLKDVGWRWSDKKFPTCRSSGCFSKYLLCSWERVVRFVKRGMTWAWKPP